MILEKKRVHFLLFVVGVIALSITAEKCRELVGQEAASKSGKFTLLNCFDGSSGTLACLVKEGVKLYFYNIRSLHVEGARHKAMEAALTDALSQGMGAQDATKQALKEGAKAAKLATRQAKRVIGPIISSGWDFFEALYYGGTMTEGFLRGTGTLFGTYYVGFLGEQKFGRFGYLLGSHLGSWVGGRVGIMAYDVVNGLHLLLEVSQSVETKIQDQLTDEVYESAEVGSSEASEDSSFASAESSSEAPDLSYASTESRSEAPEDSSYSNTGSSSEAAEDSSYMDSEGSSEAPEDPSIFETLTDTITDMVVEASAETTVDEPSDRENSESYEEL